MNVTGPNVFDLDGNGDGGDDDDDDDIAQRESLIWTKTYTQKQNQEKQ